MASKVCAEFLLWRFYYCRDQGLTFGIIHSVDIHPSRKHTCLVRYLLCQYLYSHLAWKSHPYGFANGYGLCLFLNVFSILIGKCGCYFHCFTQLSKHKSYPPPYYWRLWLTCMRLCDWDFMPYILPVSIISY